MALRFWMSGIRESMEKHKSLPFMDAILAATALVACADGKSSPEEEAQVLEYFQNSDQLSMYDRALVEEQYHDYIQLFINDPMENRDMVMTKLKKFKGKPEGELIIAVCCLVAEAVMNFETEEHFVIDEMCKELGLPPSMFK